jgi:predicted AAA+ superfamily ATPase
MIKRELYLNKIESFIDKPIIKVLTGIRRCGKSTIFKQIVKKLEKSGVNRENIILINFELQKYSDIQNISQLDELINSKIKNNSQKNIFYLMKYKILGWEKLVNSYLAEDIFDIYITGSNAKLLSGELATYLTGRYVEIKIYPFHFLNF